MIATSKINTQGLQINRSDTSNRKLDYSTRRIMSKNTRKQTRANINSVHSNKLDNIQKLDNLFKISLNFENNFLKNLNNTYKESVNILDNTYKKSTNDLDESYKSSIQNLENTYNISKHNLDLGYRKSKKTLESNFDKAFDYLKKNFEIKQQLDKEQEEKLKKEKVIQQMYKEPHQLDKEQSTSNISWKQFIENRKQEINNEKQKEQFQKNIQEQRNQLILEKRLHMEKLEFQKQKELAKNKNESIIKLVENSVPVDITNFFLHKNIDSNNYKYALTIYSGIGSATKYLYKNNRPSISYTDDLDVSQGFINWKNVEYNSTSKFITLILYSNETKNDKIQTELIKKPFVGNIKISNTKVLNTSLEYYKNPKVIINGKETKFQYQLLLKFKVENKIELDSNINISWLLEF
jgi:hypothetical protein